MHDIVYRTLVYWIDPSPLGLVGNQWPIEHRCTRCRQTMPTNQLPAHPQAHATPTTPPKPHVGDMSPKQTPRQRALPRDHWR
jgi:hypothetical protein